MTNSIRSVVEGADRTGPLDAMGRDNRVESFRGRPMQLRLPNPRT